MTSLPKREVRRYSRSASWRGPLGPEAAAPGSATSSRSLSSDHLGRRPCSSAVSFCPSPDPDAFLGPVALAFAVYAIFNGGPLILERIYPTSCSRPRSKPRRSVSCTGTIGVGAATLAPSRHSGLSATCQRHHVDRRRNCRRGCAGELLHGTRNSGQEPARGRLAVS